MDYTEKSREELIKELEEAKSELHSIRNTFHLNVNQLHQTEFQLGERRKELRCHNMISEFFSDSKISVETAVENIVGILPDAMQFPEFAEASIEIREKVFKTKRIEGATLCLEQPISSDGINIGKIRICYHEKEIPPCENIFLPEETDLLFSIAVRIGNFIDKAEKKKIELELQKSEETYRKMVERINDVVYEVTNEGIVKYVSPAIERVLGYKPEELTGRNFFGYMFSDDRPLIIDALANLATREPLPLEYRYFRKNGELRWVQSSTAPVFKDGIITGGIGILTDIHERKTAEFALRKSEERLISLINSQTNYVLRTDLN
jgi:PAS domain S-box-containing protein